jgi:hypothetical protein
LPNDLLLSIDQEKDEQSLQLSYQKLGDMELTTPITEDEEFIFVVRLRSQTYRFPLETTMNLSSRGIFKLIMTSSDLSIQPTDGRRKMERTDLLRKS